MFYWVLSRLEEIDSIGVDQHGRFMARHSHAFRHGYLDRPVVDEWFDVLGQVAARLWPALCKQNASLLSCHTMWIGLHVMVSPALQHSPIESYEIF